MPGTRLSLACILTFLVVVPACDNSPYCHDGLSWCWAQCVDLMTDRQHCGSCVTACGSDQTCMEGLCCRHSQTNCNGTCSNLNYDFDNCGACGKACHDDELCIGGSCMVVDGCEAFGLTTCGDVCADLSTDEAHCGACGNACEFPNAYGECVNGVCQVGACDEYWGDCNGEKSDGCEVDLKSDNANCGSCGYSCYDDEYCENRSCVHDEIECSEYPEVCDGVDNNCNDIVDEGPEADESCDDGNDCTDDVCVPGQGCVNMIITDPCDDGDDCTVNDSCRGGMCTGDYLDRDQDGSPPIPCGLDCDDNDPNVNPDMFEGGCGNDPVCSDGKDNDCDGITDREQPSCNLCAGDAYCDNGDACDGVERCINGCCVSGTPVYCDDGDGCTQNLCNSGSGECSYPPEADGTRCDDGDECTVGDICIAGVCRPGTPLDCDLGLACCSDRCVDLSSNIYHCGQCDNPCDVGSGFMCRNGSCEHCEAVEYSVLPESLDDVELWNLPGCVSLYSEPERAWVVRDLECYQQLEISVSEEPDFNLYELVFVCDPFHGCEWDVIVLSVLDCDDYIALDYQVIAPCWTCDAEIPICKAVLIPNSQKPVHANAELVSETDCD